MTRRCDLNDLLSGDKPRVPNRFVGLWRRTLHLADNLADEQFQVFWLQTPRVYVDIRIPNVLYHTLEQGVKGTKNLQGLLTRQEAFAGYAQVDGDYCRWHRLIDFQPDNDWRDIGRMRFENIHSLIEEGVTRPYQERWLRQNVEGIETVALISDGVVKKNGDWRPQLGIVVVLGNYMMGAIDRSVALPSAPSLQGVLDREDVPVDVALDCLVFMAQRDRVGYHTSMATVPHYWHCPVASFFAPLQAHEEGTFVQQLEGGQMRHWHVIDGDVRALGELYMG